ncbi:MAG: hypothetical protein ACRDGK_10365 [Actinomycetota bacterium]
MARFLRMSDEDVERLFRGLPPEDDEDLRDLAGFLAEAADTLSRPPRRDVEAEHLALLAGSIRTRPAGLRGSSEPITAEAPVARPTERKRRGLMRIPAVRRTAKVTVAAASLVVLTAGLAFAGVDLPGTAAETAFAKVLGVELPNQAEEHAGSVPEELPESAADTANAVLDMIREWRSGVDWSGCEFGATVSAAARGESEPDTSHCEAGGASGSVASAGSENAAKAAEGLETADEASGGAASDGADNADEGLQTGDEASGGAGSEGSDNADEGLATAEDGLGTADEATGGSVPGGVGGP